MGALRHFRVIAWSIIAAVTAIYFVAGTARLLKVEWG
jgi:hypothetical protein